MASSKGKGNSNSHGGSNHPAAGAGGDDDEDNGGRQAVNADANASHSKRIGSNSSHNNGHPKKRRHRKLAIYDVLLASRRQPTSLSMRRMNENCYP